MNDRKTGYMLLILIFGTVLIIIGYSIRIIFFPRQTRTIIFDRITNLQIDDPVKIRGADVGKVSSIHQVTRDETTTIYVVFTVLKPFDVFPDYYIYSTDKGLMGDRVIYILQGNKTGQPIPQDDTLRGTWTPSVSDALGSAWKLSDKIKALTDGAGVFLSGTPNKESFVKQFSDFSVAVDSFCYEMEETVHKLKGEVPVKLDSIYSVISSVKSHSRTIADDVPAHIKKIEDQIKATLAFVNKMEKQSQALSTVMDKIQDNNLVSKDQITPLLEQVETVQTLLNEIKNGLVRFRAKLVIGDSPNN